MMEQQTVTVVINLLVFPVYFITDFQQVEFWRTEII